MRLHYDVDSLDNWDLARIDRFHRWYYEPLRRYFRAEVRGLERIPEGAALYVGNHSGGLLTPDSFIFGGALYRARGAADLPYGLAHAVAIQFPIVHQFIVPFGAVRASHENAMRIFAAGRKAIVYPGGDLDDMRPFRHRDRVVFGGRQGYVRLAIRAGVPVVPVVTAGSHETLIVLDDGRWLARWLHADRLLRSKVWPISLCLPWGLWIGPMLVYLPFPTWMLQEVQAPIRLERSGEAAAGDDAYVASCAAQVESAMQAALTRLAAERRERGGALHGLLPGR
jgi:1-acyl-sn-glycerol-3-phosphate acyltransferase